jgi:pyridoxal phosphate enzyme (YggS family)
MQTSIADRYSHVLERIAENALHAGRRPQDVRLVVVTKGHALPAVREAADAGASNLGENYTEEAVGKMDALEGRGLTWHMIGHVQSRKAGVVAGRFDWVHSVDRYKLAERLDRFAGEAGRKLPVLLECNVSGEETKFGWSTWDRTAWPEMVKNLRLFQTLQHLEIRGLMTMAPYLSNPEDSRPYFKRLYSLRDYLQEQLPDMSFDELSMGMSGDYEVAVQEGSTIVRVGTAIMGARPVMAAE